MPKILTSEEFDQLENLIASQPNGIGLEALLRLLPQGITRRTLQRRLALLVERGRIQLLGAGRGAKYALTAQAGLSFSENAPNKIAPYPRFVSEPEPPSYSRQTYVPLSPEGEVVKRYVTQSVQQRKPVGYQLGFLEQYQPNVTFYLPESMRSQLHLMGRPPVQTSLVGNAGAAAGTFAKDILSRLLIDLSWASSRLEGNTYSQLDTERLIEQGQAAQGKDALETQMILNHKAAIEYLVMNSPQAGVSVETVTAVHALLSDGLMQDPLACGRVRSRVVGIGGSVYHPLAVPQQLEELLGHVMGMAAEVQDPFEQAFFLMVHLPYLQPFEDVNKRVSRLACNIPFIAHNLCPLSFIDVPQQAYVDAMLGVYELNRVELLRDVFLWAYQRSCQQYVAVIRQMVPPDTFRLRYRQELGACVAAIVRSELPALPEGVRQHMPGSVALVDQERFVTLVLDEFKSLHVGNAVRFGLRPLELAQWEASAKSA
jgi:hypothetical protein